MVNTTADKASNSAAPSVTSNSRKNVDKVGDLDQVNGQLKSTIEKSHRDLTAQIGKLEVKEKQLLERLSKLDDEKVKTAEVHGTVDVSDDDLIEINAGGKVIAAKRGTLTQLPGSRLSALFSGRWDKKLIRDDKRRIFLDVNGDCFQAIVDYLNELAISSEDDAPGSPSVDNELQHILTHQMAVFGIVVEPQFDSKIVTRHSDEEILHNWLKEDGSDGGLAPLYRSSRDGLSGSKFHSKCDNKGPTLVIIETTDGGVIGGYTNSSWRWSSTGQYICANKAFLFALSGFGLSSPCKMKLTNSSNYNAIYNKSTYGPIFGGGHDLKLHYQGIRSVSSDEQTAAIQRLFIDTFSEKVNDVINKKWTALEELEVDLLELEESFKDEAKFVDSFASEDANDIVKLNVSGTLMTTSRRTLMLCEDSKLAQQFDDSKWAEEGFTSNMPRVKPWSPDDVTNWVKGLDDVPDDIATLFWENEIKGSELLALSEYGLKMIGVKRTGTICLLHDEIKKLKEASQDTATATLIEYSPYCFGKIIDHLRLMRLHDAGLIDKPALPEVCESQKKRFEKIVKYYFPGGSSKFILG